MFARGRTDEPKASEILSSGSEEGGESTGRIGVVGDGGEHVNPRIANPGGHGYGGAFDSVFCK